MVADLLPERAWPSPALVPAGDALVLPAGNKSRRNSLQLIIRHPSGRFGHPPPVTQLQLKRKLDDTNLSTAIRVRQMILTVTVHAHSRSPLAPLLGV